MKFSESDWVMVSNSIKEHLIFQRPGQVAGTLEISLKLAFEGLVAKSQIAVSSRFSYRTNLSALGHLIHNEELMSAHGNTFLSFSLWWVNSY